MLQYRRERHRLGRDRVAAAQLGRLDAELARRLVDDRLDHIDRLGPAAAAVGGDRHRIGQHRDDFGVNRRDAVGIDQAAEPDRQRYRRAVGRIIGADRRLPLRPQRQKPPFLVERQRGLDDAAAPLLVAQQPFAALGDPAHRTPGDLGCPQRQRIFRIAAALHAKAAAHIVADHAELVLRQFEDAVGQCRPGGMHRLDRAADRIAVLIRGRIAARQPRGSMLFAVTRLIGIGVADNAVGLGKGRIDSGLVADLVKERLVARVLVPHRGRAGRKRRFGADHRRQRLVLDLDQFGGILCLVQRLGDDERDRVPDIADAVLRQQRLRADKGRRAIAPPAAHAGHQGAEPAPAQILAGQHGEHAGRGRAACRISIAAMRACGMRRAQHIAARFVRGS